MIIARAQNGDLADAGWLSIKVGTSTRTFTFSLETVHRASVLAPRALPALPIDSGDSSSIVLDPLKRLDSGIAAVALRELRKSGL